MEFLNRDLESIWSDIQDSAADCYRRMQKEEIKAVHVEEVSLSVISILFAVFTLSSISPAITEARANYQVATVASALTTTSGLTQTQVQAILSLLRSFNADETVINNVNAALTGTPVISSVPTQWCHTFNNDLTVGATGDDVTSLMQVLDKEELFQYRLATYDNSFDESVAAAVVQFQAKYGIRQTGYVGPKTRAKLSQLYGCNGSAAILPNGDPDNTNSPVNIHSRIVRTTADGTEVDYTFTPSSVSKWAITIGCQSPVTASAKGGGGCGETTNVSFENPSYSWPIWFKNPTNTYQTVGVKVQGYDVNGNLVGADSDAVTIPPASISTNVSRECPTGYIWNGYQCVPPVQSSNGETVVFEKSFSLDNASGPIVLALAADNQYRVTVNGKIIGVSTGDWNFTSPHVYDITSAVQTGANTLQISVFNNYVTGAPETGLGNPAGLTYRIARTSNSCTSDMGCVSSGTSVVVSDGSETISGGRASVLSNKDPKWVNIDGAKWIWSTDYYASSTVSTQPICTLTSDKASYTLGDVITFSWTSQNATYASWQQDTSGKDYLVLPGDKLAASGSQTITANVIGNPSVTLLVGGYGSNGSCSKTVNVVDRPTNVQPTITVSSPNGGETLTVGQTYRISWKYSGILNHINIAWYQVGPNGERYGGSDIATVMASNNYYDWQVPSSSGNWKILLNQPTNEVQTGQQLAMDESDVAFAVTPSTIAEPSIVISTRVAGRVIGSTENGTCVSNLRDPNGLNNTGGCVRTFLTQTVTGTYTVQWYGGYPTGADTSKSPTITPQAQTYPSLSYTVPQSTTFYLDFAGITSNQ